MKSHETIPEITSVETPKLVHAGLLYSIVAFLFLTLGAYVQRRELSSGILITEFGIILLPALLLLIINKCDIPKVLRLNRVSLLNLFIIFSMMLFSLWIVTVLNLFNLWLIKTIFGKVAVSPLPIYETPLIINILLIGGTAGICEEVMFRGVIQRSLERFGASLSIVIAAFLFGLFHMDFQKLLGTFLLGILIGFIVYRTNSLFAGMFAHFANNSLAVLISSLQAGTNEASEIAGSADLNAYFAMLESMPPFQLTVVIVIFIASILFCGAALAGLIWAFVHNTAKTKDASVRKTRTGKVWPAVLAFLPGLILIAFVYLYLAYGMSGIKLDFIGRWFGL